jgi:hypothetical protein
VKIIIASGKKAHLGIQTKRDEFFSKKREMRVPERKDRGTESNQLLFFCYNGSEGYLVASRSSEIDRVSSRCNI